jgi:hypothetical protein
MTTIGLLGALGILGAPGPDVTPGTMPAWALVFSEDTAKPNKKPPVTVSSYTYDGSVTATLPAKLAGGRYEVIVEGLSDDDYRLIRLPAGNRLMADLHLTRCGGKPGSAGTTLSLPDARSSWRDSASPGSLADSATSHWTPPPGRLPVMPVYLW